MKKIKWNKIAEESKVSPALISRLLKDDDVDPLRPSWKAARRLAKTTKTKPGLWMEATRWDIEKAVNLKRGVE